MKQCARKGISKAKTLRSQNTESLLRDENQVVREKDHAVCRETALDWKGHVQVVITNEWEKELE